ncbi:hypothetical protein OROHE_005506 [Orobanche hederae]
METELAVEPQSLKKLSFKSVKRILDLFSHFHSQFRPPDPERDYILLMRSSGFSRGVSKYRGVASSGGTNCCLLMFLFVRKDTPGPGTSGTPADCAYLCISKTLSPRVTNGINKGSNCCYHIFSTMSNWFCFSEGNLDKES